jgi:predicted O-methyltransferase YrrM
MKKHLRHLYKQILAVRGKGSWHSEQPQYREYLLTRKSQKLDILQIGVFRGAFTIWLIENILVNNKESFLEDVDTWKGSLEHEQMDTNFIDVEVEYDKRVKQHNQVHKNKTTSDNFFLTNSKKYDFIYIDGDHSRDQVTKDANNALHSCRVGGIIAFDDYDWMPEWQSKDRPKDAIDLFIEANQSRIKVLHKESQVWIQVIS